MRWRNTPKEAAEEAMYSLVSSRFSLQNVPVVWQVAVIPETGLSEETLPTDAICRVASVRVRFLEKYGPGFRDVQYDPEMWRELEEDIARQRAAFDAPVVVEHPPKGRVLGQ